MKNLTTELKNDLFIEVQDFIKENAEGSGFIRIKLYPNELQDVISGKKEYSESEIVGVHTFISSNSDDIEAAKMIELISFKQDDMSWVEGDGEWTDTINGENWLNEKMKEVESILNSL